MHSVAAAAATTVPRAALIFRILLAPRDAATNPTLLRLCALGAAGRRTRRHTFSGPAPRTPLPHYAPVPAPQRSARQCPCRQHLAPFTAAVEHRAHAHTPFTGDTCYLAHACAYAPSTRTLPAGGGTRCPPRATHAPHAHTRTRARAPAAFAAPSTAASKWPAQRPEHTTLTLPISHRSFPARSSYSTPPRHNVRGSHPTYPTILCPFGTAFLLLPRAPTTRHRRHAAIPPARHHSYPTAFALWLYGSFCLR